MYTSGVSDVNYIQPLFAILIVVANAGHCLRLPYNIMILAGGHYKQTQRNYIIAAIINIVISIVAVKTWGLVGVAIGTAIAMFYQTIWMAFYDSKNLIKWPFTKFLKQIAVDFITVFFLHIIANPEIGGKISVINRIFVLSTVSYVSWIVLAIKLVMLTFLLVVSINFIFYKVYVIKVKKGVSEMIRKMIGGV